MGLAITLASCTNNVDKKDINLLNGYWEIEKATMPDGTKKEFKINETVDFFKIEKDSGIRQKVTPQFDGKYLVSSGPEKVTVKDSIGKVFLEYKTVYRKWTEELTELSSETITLKNAAGMMYQYKKYEGFSIKQHG